MMDYRERLLATATGASLSLFASEVDEKRERFITQACVNRTGSVASYARLAIDKGAYKHYLFVLVCSAGVSHTAIYQPIHLYAGEILVIELVSTTATDVYEVTLSGYEAVVKE